MDIWLSRQQSRVQDDWLSKQVASSLQSQMPATSSFNTDEWLARQQSKTEDDWLAKQAATPASSFSQDEWLARQTESENAASGDGTFTQAEWAPAASWEADQDLEQSLLSDIEEALGKAHRKVLEGRIGNAEDRMKSMFQALPKNEYGKLGHSTVRYMLHRFFVEQHGWFIDGLFAEGAALNTSSPSHMLKDRVPMFVEGLFEKRLGGRGFGVREMATLVAVVEDSIQSESQTELKKTYSALGLPLDTNFDEPQVELLVEVYMGGFALNTNMSNVSADYLYRQTANMIDFYPTWPRAQKFFREVRQTITPGRESYSFGEVSLIVKHLVDTFGTFHGKQCQGLKDTLTGLEKKGASGCINLPDFYEKGLKADTNWLFIESPEYLRQLGALNENDSKNPRLLTANYINGPNNCLQPTGYYMVCCHNQCDDILGGLEKQLGAPSATPMEIIAALQVNSNLNGASLRSGSLAPALRRRLSDVAEHHDGRVPIHGRLFAQWLHHVFPRECPYPHMSGSKHPQWVEDFEEETGKSSQLSDDEMAVFVLNASSTADSSKAAKVLAADVGSCAPWQNEEELFAPIPRTFALPLHELEDDPHVWGVSSGIAFLAAASAFTVSLLKTCKSMTKLTNQPKKMLHI